MRDKTNDENLKRILLKEFKGYEKDLKKNKLSLSTEVKIYVDELEYLVHLLEKV